MGLECSYPEGVCACNPSFGPVIQTDAGSNWRCDQPGEGCPSVKPLLGSSCPTPDKSCVYGDCSRANGSTVRCKDTLWKEGGFSCPLH